MAGTQNDDKLPAVVSSHGRPLKIPGALIKKRREEKGITQQQLAKDVETSQQTIDRIEKGFIKYSKHFYTIMSILGITPDEIGHQLPKSLVSVTDFGLVHDTNDLPLLATAGRINNSTYILGRKPVAYIPRPANLHGLSNAYGIVMPDNSMFPRYDAGGILLIDDTRPITPGNAYVFYANDHIRIRYLVAVKKDHYDVKSFESPDSIECLLHSEWTTAHMIVGHFTHMPDTYTSV